MACGYFNSSGDQLYWTQECVQIQTKLIGQVRNNAYVFGVAALSFLKCLYQLQQFGLSVFQHVKSLVSMWSSQFPHAR